MSVSRELISKLNALRVQVTESDYLKCGYHLDVFLKQEQVRLFAQAMLDGGFYLDFVTAVHVKPHVQVVYQFATYEEACRVNAKAIACDDDSIPTISDIYDGANWHERETHDFYGLTFTGHPDLRVLLLSDEDCNLKPLLKREDKLLDIEGITRKVGDETDKKSEITKKTIKPELD